MLNTQNLAERMKVKVQLKAQRRLPDGEIPAPPSIDAEFADTEDALRRRRSVQISVPDDRMLRLMGIHSAATGTTLSEATRAIWEPRLAVILEILQELGAVNQFGNLYDPATVNDIIDTNQRAILVAYIERCTIKGLDVDFIPRSGL